MRFKIDDQTRNMATLCRKRHSCLTGDRDDLCRIRYCIEDAVHFIECLTDEACAYQKNYGGRIYCDCPVRKAIYNIYGT